MATIDIDSFITSNQHKIDGFKYYKTGNIVVEFENAPNDRCVVILGGLNGVKPKTTYTYNIRDMDLEQLKNGKLVFTKRIDSFGNKMIDTFTLF